MSDTEPMPGAGQNLPNTEGGVVPPTNTKEKSFSLDAMVLGGEGREAFEKLLPGWESTQGAGGSGLGYKLTKDGKTWLLTVDPGIHRVSFSEERGTLNSPRIEMRNAERIDVDEQREDIDFVHRNGTRYRVSGQGLTHALITPDSEVIVSLNL